MSRAVQGRMTQGRITLPTGRAGRLCAAGLTLLAVAALLLGVVMPLCDGYAARAEALSRQAVLARRMAALVASLPELRREAAAAGAASGGAALLPGGTDSAASALLQERLQAGLAQNGVALNTVETLAGEEAGAYRRIRLRLAVTASWPALVAWLRDVGEATPAMFVDELQIQPALHKIGTAPNSFDLTCTVLGFRPVDAKVAER